MSHLSFAEEPERAGCDHIKTEFGFERRERRPPPDPTNSMLGYGYTVLQSRVERELLVAGLSPYEGIIHASYRNRPSLSFDLTEEFRQPIVDRAVITHIVRKQVSPDDFVYDGGGCFIDGDAKKEFLDALYLRLEQEYTYQGEKMQFLDIISEQAKRLASAIANDESYTGFRW